MKQDITEEMFYTQKTVDKKDNTNITVTHYTVIGDHDSIQDNKPITNDETKSLAKTIETNGNTRYFVKIGAYGKLYNPIGMYSEGKDKKFLSKIGKNQFEFKQVNMKVFDLYVEFLRSRNVAWLNNAQRGLI